MVTLQSLKCSHTFADICNVCILNVWTEADREKDGAMDDKPDPLAQMTDEVKVSCAEVVALLDLMEKTGYSMVQENGQRKYGGPPPGQNKYLLVQHFVLMGNPSLSCEVS